MPEIVAIIEDETSLSSVLVEVLKDEGYKAKSFERASSFYDYLKHKKPDIAFIDIMLPEVSGKMIAKSLKENQNTKDIKIILMSASNSVRKIAHELGIKNVLQKPFSLGEFIEKVN